MCTPEDLATKIMFAQRNARHAKHKKLYEPRSTTASSLGYKCERRIVYSRTEPHYAEQVGEELASIFEEGNLHQSDVRRELIELGFEALEAERTFRDEKLEIGGRTVDLKKITMPLLNIYAAADHLVPPSSTMPLNDLVGTKDKELYEFKGGHIGVFVGSKSQKELAPTVAEWLHKRSKGK